MIAETIDFLCKELNTSEALPSFAVIGNAALISDPGASDNLSQDVVVSLVNIEEEKTLKNSPHYVTNGDALSKRNPTIYLNLYVLFCCANTQYFQALGKLQRVLLFFQKQYVFTRENSATPFPTAAGVEKIVLDLFTLNFEQINHLWGVLGGKYHPSVLYKLRIVAVQNAPLNEVSEVRDIESNANLR